MGTLGSLVHCNQKLIVDPNTPPPSPEYRTTIAWHWTAFRLSFEAYTSFRAFFFPAFHSSFSFHSALSFFTLRSFVVSFLYFGLSFILLSQLPFRPTFFSLFIYPFRPILQSALSFPFQAYPFILPFYFPSRSILLFRLFFFVLCALSYVFQAILSF
jgi:hypothetical protein